MKMHFLRIAVPTVILAATVPALPTAATAQDLKAERQRMEQRLSSIDALKSSGAVGENNRGLLEARASIPGDAAQLISAENSDRSAVYAGLARKTGSSPDQIGRARAKQIAQNSRSGVWIQRENGEWYKK